MCKNKVFQFIVFFGAFFVCLPAQAYIGPAVALLASLFGPIIAVLALIGMIVIYPAFKFVKNRRAKKSDKKAEKGKAPES